MGVYENINGSQIPIASNLRFRNVPIEGLVTEEELLQGLTTKNDVFQYDTMPTASSSLEGKVVQYVGETTASYTKGHFYECVSDGAVTPSYSWVEKNVQSGGGEVDAEDVKFKGDETIFGINHLVIRNPAFQTLENGVYTFTAPKAKEGNIWADYIITPEDIDGGICKVKINITEISGKWLLYCMFNDTNGVTKYYTPLPNFTTTGEKKYTVDLNWFTVYYKYDGGDFHVVVANNIHSTDETTYEIKINQYDTIVESGGEYGDKTLPQVVSMLDAKINNIGTDNEIILSIPSGDKYVMQLDNKKNIVFTPQLPNNILYIGNSLLLGFGNHGMASTTINDDYYAKVNAYLTSKGITPTTKKLSGVDFENATTDSAITTWINNSLASKMSDDIQLVLIGIGDNVNTSEKISEFTTSCGMLCSYIREHCPNARVAWFGLWYASSGSVTKLNIIKEACDKYGVTFIDISDLKAIEGNMSHIGATYIDAQGNEQTITQEGVASHPSDQGFTAIANRIIDALFT